MYTTNDISAVDFVDNFMANNPNPKGSIVVELQDGPFEMPVRTGLINIILWQSYFKHNTIPSSTDYTNINHINGNTFSTIQTRIYKQFIKQMKQATLDMGPSAKYKYEKALVDSLIDSFWVAINQIYRFVDIYCGTSVQSLSVLSLCRLCKQSKIKELQDIKLDQTMGTKSCEIKLKTISDELFDILSSPTELEYNPLLEFMETSMLNANQIPQLLLAYGPRSDIDDTMKKYVVNASTISGLQNTFDYGIEALGAKKAGHSNKVVIKNSQYFYRRLRLVCSSQTTLYPGDCGSTITIKHVLKDKHKKNFIGKVVIDNNEPIVLTKDNINDYVGKEIHLKSPLGCKHKDGTCVACAGRGDNDVIYFVNPEHHIGISGASKVGSSVSQMVLSAKHLIKTNTKLYTLPNDAKKYMFLNKDQIFWSERALAKLKGGKMRIPLQAMGPIEDLSYIGNLPVRETYSNIEEFELLNNHNEVIGKATLTDGTFVPFFTKQSLNILAKHVKQLEITETTITIPLDLFTSKKAFMKYIVVNDDMIAFTESIDKFLKTTIGGYTSISQLLRDFTSILYSKTNVNVFFVEIVLKAFLISSRDDFRMPSVEDPEDVVFGTMSSILTGRDLSTKLGFEKLSKYFKDVTTYTNPRNSGLFDIFFGI